MLGASFKNYGVERPIATAQMISIENTFQATSTYSPFQLNLQNQGTEGIIYGFRHSTGAEGLWITRGGLTYITRDLKDDGSWKAFIIIA